MPSRQLLNGEKFDLIFIDPPYGKKYIEQVIAKESFNDLLSDDGIIIAEQSSRETLEIESEPESGPAILEIYRQKKYSHTIISLIRKTQKG
jgi:16S rRNA (guanine966-N2)-methyltransferase